MTQHMIKQSIFKGEMEMKAFVVAAALAVLATPALAVDYLVHDQDGHGTTKCEFAQAVEVDIVGFDYSSGDRTFMCLAPIPTTGHSLRGMNSGGGSGPTLPAPAPVAPETPPASIPATPLVPATPTTPPSVPSTPLFPATPTPQPDPEPGECQKVSDCPNEPDPKPDPDPDPKPCERKVDCVGPAPDPEPTGPRLCNAKGECRP